MKNYIYTVFLLGLTLGFQSCSENADPRFFVDVERNFEVNSSLNSVVTHFFELKNVPTNLNQNLDIFGMSRDEITSINPGDATITNATGIMDWSLVNSVEIYAISRSNPDLRRQIFYIRERDPGNSQSVRLFNTFADMSEIMEEETMDLEVRITTIVSVPGNFLARLTFNYAVFDEI